jgi:hypothetical protein
MCFLQLSAWCAHALASGYHEVWLDGVGHNFVNPLAPQLVQVLHGTLLGTPSSADRAQDAGPSGTAAGGGGS